MKETPSLMLEGVPFESPKLGIEMGCKEAHFKWQ